MRQEISQWSGKLLITLAFGVERSWETITGFGRKTESFIFQEVEARLETVIPNGQGFSVKSENKQESRQYDSSFEILAVYLKTKKTVNTFMKLEIFWPSKKPYILNQKFGVDQSGPACKFRPEYPCDKTLYQHLGLKGHDGIDFQQYTIGSPYIVDFPLYSPIDGVVEYTENDPNLGLGVVIRTLAKYEDVNGQLYYWKVRLWHLARNSIVARIGQQVKIGDYLGLADNTGLSSGLHCHFDLKPLKDDFSNVFQNNGFFGAVDLMPYIQTMTAYELKTNLSKIAEMIESLGRQISEFIKRKK